MLDDRFPPCLWGDFPDGYSLHAGDGSPLWLRIGSRFGPLRSRLRQVWIARGYWYLYPDEDVDDEERASVPEGWTVKQAGFADQVVVGGWISIAPGESSSGPAPLVSSLRRPRSSSAAPYVRLAAPDVEGSRGISFTWSWWRPIGWVVELSRFAPPSGPVAQPGPFVGGRVADPAPKRRRG